MSRISMGESSLKGIPLVISIWAFAFLTFGAMTDSDWGVSFIMSILATIIITLALVRQEKKKSKKTKKRYSILASDDLFSRWLLVLVAAVIQADKKDKEVEFHIIRRALREHYSELQTEKYMGYIDDILSRGEVKIPEVCREIRQDFDLSGKIELMHLLIGIAASDGVMMDAERSVLKEIARYMRVPYATYTSIFKMFNFRNEGWEKKQEKKQSYSSKYRLKQAFEILQVDEAATVSQIKKAYRKLALLHHPDRVIHLGDEYQKDANTKFQTISDAYEYIKEKKGFS